MQERPFDVVFCDDTKPMEEFNLTPEQQIREKQSIEKLRRKFFGKKEFDESAENLRMAV